MPRLYTKYWFKYWLQSPFRMTYSLPIASATLRMNVFFTMCEKYDSLTVSYSVPFAKKKRAAHRGRPAIHPIGMATRPSSGLGAESAGDALNQAGSRLQSEDNVTQCRSTGNASADLEQHRTGQKDNRELLHLVLRFALTNPHGLSGKSDYLPGTKYDIVA